MKATNPFFEYPLVACTKPAFAELRALTDLSQNVDVLRSILDQTNQFFDFNPNWPLFSGYARPAMPGDGSHPLFYVQLWEDEEVVRSWAFRGLGAVGILHIAYREDHNGHIHFQDLLKAVFYGVGQQKTLPQYAEEQTLVLVDGEMLSVPIGWKS